MMARVASMPASMPAVTGPAVIGPAVIGPVMIGLVVIGLLAGCNAVPSAPSSGAQSEAPPSKSEILTRALATTVQVLTERPEGVRRTGSAVVLGSDAGGERTLILTAHHLLAPPVEQTVAVRFAGAEEAFEAEWIAADAAADLALLALPGAATTGIELRVEAELGDPVWVVAFPWGRRRTVVGGVVSQLAIDPHGSEPGRIVGPVALIDASVSHGMSGGAVLHGISGELVGLVRGYRTAQLALPGEGVDPLRLPVAGETTVVSGEEIVCFLEAEGLATLAVAALEEVACRGRPPG
jgi:S1-C subfamily serine protease